MRVGASLRKAGDGVESEAIGRSSKVGDGLKLGEVVYCLGHVCVCKGQGGISSGLGPCPPQSRPSPLAAQCCRTFFLDGRLSTWRCIGYTFPAHCFCARLLPSPGGPVMGLVPVQPTARDRLRRHTHTHTHMAAVTAGLVPTCNTVGGGGNSSGNGGGGSMHIHVTLSLCCAVTSNQGWVQWVPPALPKGLSRRPGLTSWRNKRRTRNRGRLRGRSDSGFVWIMAGPVLALEG